MSGNRLKLLFIAFAVLHLFLFNINVAEWGDSYRILRASEFIRDFAYPTDEKRPPLFSIVLALRPAFFDQVFWGRVVLFIFSIGAFLIFVRLCDLLLKNNMRAKFVALLLFALNPVYLYWSLRIMADVPFSFLVLLVFYLYLTWQYRLSIKRIVLLGFLVGLGVLTRFEGYILFGALGLGFLLAKRFKSIVVYVFSFGFTILPYLYLRNPLTSSYFGEPSGRVYDSHMVAIFIASVLFLFGVTSALAFLLTSKESSLQYFLKNPVLTSFTLVGLLLILLWPAAVPRLFVPIIPFLIIPLANGISIFFEQGRRFSASFFALALLGTFIVSQYFLRLQFLVPIKWLFILVILIQLVNIYSIITKKFRIFLISCTLSLALWSFASIWLHKDVFIAVQAGALYASQHLHGTVGYNDVSSVSDWYLNQKTTGTSVKGTFFNYSKKADLEYSILQEKGFDYLLLTNEHNPDMTLDIESRPYLEELKEFRYVVNGEEFFTKIIKVL